MTGKLPAQELCARQEWLSDGATSVISALLVEDNIYYARLLEQMLNSSKSSSAYSIRLAGTCQQAEELLDKETPQIIILDLNLPDSSGLDTLQRIKERAHDAPILVLTGSEGEQLGLQAVCMGAQDYLVKQYVKPYSIRRAVQYAKERKRFGDMTLRLSAIHDFMSALAHDMKAPLVGEEQILNAMISGHVGEFSDQQLQLLKTLKRGCNSQLSLVNKLIEIYQFEAGTYVLDSKSLDLYDLLEQVISQTRAKSEKNFDCRLSRSGEDTTVSADERSLQRLFISLFENAVRHGDPQRGVDVFVQPGENSIFVHIHNWGEPIPKEQLSNTCDRFWIGVPGKNYVALTGYGLYLSHLIAKINGGQLRITSTREDGTRVSV
ncbi:MAG: hybrid sensor histidine kinase/response regulator, partial [Candidatus Melainabacteria bacterium]|nr:hybrid sensor histidine kinase/response regulator [Candidatus Melainabacteria bacterium]